MTSFDAIHELATIHELQHRPQHQDLQRDEDDQIADAVMDAEESCFDTLLEEFATVWMDTASDDQSSADDETTPIIGIPAHSHEACTIVDLTDDNIYASSTDDAVSVVSQGTIDDSAEPQVQPLRAKFIRKSSSFIKTCWDIDSFMDTAVNWDE